MSLCKPLQFYDFNCHEASRGFSATAAHSKVNVDLDLNGMFNSAANRRDSVNRNDVTGH